MWSMCLPVVTPSLSGGARGLWRLLRDAMRRVLSWQYLGDARQSGTAGTKRHAWQLWNILPPKRTDSICSRRSLKGTDDHAG